MKWYQMSTNSCYYKTWRFYLKRKIYFNQLFKVTYKLHENTPADKELVQVDDKPSFESARHS